MTHIKQVKILVQEVVVEGNITFRFKTEGIIESGGQAKWFLQDFEVLIMDNVKQDVAKN